MSLHFMPRFIVVMFALFGLLIPVSSARQSSEARIIKPEWRPKKDADLPVAITKIKTAGQEVFLNTEFTADGDWLSGLTFTVKNLYSKPMVLVNIHLVLHDSIIESEERVSIYTMAAGKYEYLLTRYPGENPISVAPGDEVEVGDYTKSTMSLQRFIRDVEKSMPMIHRIGVSVNAIFVDGRIWYGEGNWGWYDINTSCKCLFPKAKSE